MAGVKHQGNNPGGRGIERKKQVGGLCPWMVREEAHKMMLPSNYISFCFVALHLYHFYFNLNKHLSNTLSYKSEKTLLWKNILEMLEREHLFPSSSPAG